MHAKAEPKMFAAKISALALALTAIGSAMAIDRGVSGLWYNPSQSGHGFAITVLNSTTASVAWYTYNKQGHPIWISSVLSETTPGQLTGTGQVLFGMRFGEFLPSTNQVFEWGTLRVTFLGCDSAIVEYNGTVTYQDDSGFGAGAVPIAKLAGVQGLGCGGSSPVDVSGVYGGVAKLTGGAEIEEAYALLEPDGTASVFLPNEAAMIGTYTVIEGQLGISLIARTVPPLVFRNNSTVASFHAGPTTYRAKDFISGVVRGASAGDAEFQVTYMGLSTRVPSLANIAGTYRDPEGDTNLTLSCPQQGPSLARMEPAATSAERLRQGRRA